MKLSKDDKEVKEFQQGIPFGVSTVQFTGAVADKTEADKDFIEVGVVDKNGVEDSARLWFVGGAVNISFNTIRQICVHNAKPENKDKARDAVDAAEDTEALASLMNEIVGNGGELWFTKYYDPKRTYQAQNGETKRSVNKNVYGYEPNERPDLMPNGQSADDRDEEKVEDFPVKGAKPASDKEKSNIPKDW